jgi:hypothetical protein
MANDKQFQIKTKFIATRGVQEYRQTIPLWVTKKDVVLEIGCEWGTTTIQIAPFCQEVIGTDISQACLDRARLLHPDIRFELLDGFDVRAALDFGKSFTKIYIDMSGLSGYRSLLDTISLLQMYATTFRPAAIVVKSGSLKLFASQCLVWWSSQYPPNPSEEEKLSKKRMVSSSH